MQMVIVSLCSIALVISILKPRKKAVKALRAAGAAATVVVGVGSLARRERERNGEAERQPLYPADLEVEARVDEMVLKRSEKVLKSVNEEMV